MWPGFNSRSRRHMWVEFVVGFLLAPRGFSPGAPVFPSPQKPVVNHPHVIWLCLLVRVHDKGFVSRTEMILYSNNKPFKPMLAKFSTMVCLSFSLKS